MAAPTLITKAVSRKWNQGEYRCLAFGHKVLLHNWLYMNAPRLRQCFVCSDIDRMGCSCISGLVAADIAAAGPDEIR